LARVGDGTSGGILGFPPAISQLVLINAAVFLLQSLMPGTLERAFALIPADVVGKGMIWQLVTYMFLHGGFMHVGFNMFGLIIFGSDLERWWGSREFLKYYFITGIGGGIVQVASTYLLGGNPLGPVIGASGAIFGVLVAYALAFPHRQILLYFLIPIPARVLVAVYAFFELAAAIQNHPGDFVAHFVHLGGALVGFVYLKQENLTWRAKRWLGSNRVSWGGSRPSRRGDDETQARIDAILEKISREGMGALTDEERRILHESAERAKRRQQGHDT
jgi:rhomboid family protein